MARPNGHWALARALLQEAELTTTTELATFALSFALLLLRSCALGGSDSAALSREKLTRAAQLLPAIVDDDWCTRVHRGLARAREFLIFVQIFFGHVIFRHFTSSNFSVVAFARFFHARDHTGLERVAFLQQLVDTFRIDTFYVGQALQISGLLARMLYRVLKLG